MTTDQKDNLYYEDPTITEIPHDDNMDDDYKPHRQTYLEYLDEMKTIEKKLR